MRLPPACLPVGSGSKILVMDRIKKEDAAEEGMEAARDLLIQGLGKIIQATFKASKEVARGFKEGYREEPEKEK